MDEGRRFEQTNGSERHRSNVASPSVRKPQTGPTVAVYMSERQLSVARFSPPFAP